MSLSDTLLIPFVILWLGQTWYWFHIGQQEWGWCWALTFVLYVIGEIVSKVKHGRTLTTRFKKWAVQHLREAIIFVGSLVLVWALLILHLVL